MNENQIVVRRRKRRILLLILIVLLLQNIPVECRNSQLTGNGYFLELIETESVSRFREVNRTNKECFLTLVDVLYAAGVKDSRFICKEEKCMIFLFLLTGRDNRNISERWQHSGSTISLIIHEVAYAIMSIGKRYIKKPSTTPSPYVTNNDRFSPYFDNCIGALDGTHIMAVISSGQQAPFRNRKGDISQNVLAVVDFNMLFTYVLVGWEGSAHDGRVLADAFHKGMFRSPNKYYLGDAGYGLSRNVLTPYRGVRYHLKEWRAGAQLPRTKEELFNHRHSSLRNVIERTFGVLKKRFPLLVNMTCFDFQFQTTLVMCAMILHNFIRIHQQYEDEYYNEIQEEERIEEEQEEEEEENEDNMENYQAFRNDIATAMWNDYNIH
jgi:hypothetical protein